MATSTIPKEKWMESKWIKYYTKGDLKLVGNGNFGSVYSFIEKKSSVEKALKVIEYETVRLEMRKQNMFIEKEKWMDEARDEIEHLRKLDNCKYILRLEESQLDFDYDCIYMVTELAENNLLKHIEKDQAGLCSWEIKKIIESILKGLSFAHKQEVVHRDIKPENILVTKSKSYLLSDWGIARKMTNSGSKIYLTSVQGTFIYLPPEIQKIARGANEKINLYKSDAYAAGLLFLVCCNVPQGRLSSIDKFDEKAHNDKILDLFKKFFKPKSSEIEKLIINLTQFNPETRWDVDQALNFCLETNIFPKDPCVDWNYKVSDEKIKILKGVSSFEESLDRLEKEPKDSTLELSDLFLDEK